MSKTLDTQRQVLAMEAFTLTDLQASLKRIFPSMIEGLKSFIGMFNSEQPALEVKKDQRAFLSKIGNSSYMDLMPIPCYVPEGLSENLVKYSAELLNHVKHSEEIMNKVLAPISTYTALLIGSKDRKFDTVGIVREMKKRETERNALLKSITDMYTAGSTNTAAKYSDLVGRNSDWDQVFRNLNEATKRINSVNRKEVNAKIAECVELFEVVQNKVAREELEGVSPEVTESLGEAVFQAAKELEYYSVTYYRVLALATAIEDSIEAVTKSITPAA